MQRITPSHLLDRERFDFENLGLESSDDLKELDLAFDPDPMELLISRSA